MGLPMQLSVKIKDLSCIFLTYNEPRREEFWQTIQRMLPEAKRVDGVLGSDAAHKAAAAASDTERFILIDGDNLPEPSFFDQTLTFDNNNVDCVLRWRARNNINGLVYGNGGISCWTKEFVNNMRTHENTDGRSETQVEFCFDRRYLPLWNCYSVTYPNHSGQQAWRAGFREGVKMCLDRGRRVSIEEFLNMQNYQNLEYLNIWHSIGADVENGRYAIYGARLGTYKVMLEPDWDYTEVQDFTKLDRLFTAIDSQTFDDQRRHYRAISKELKDKLGLHVLEMGSEQSAFFKKFYKRLHRNKDIMSS